MQPESLQVHTVATYLDDWLDHASGRVRRRTWLGYESLVRMHIKPNLGDITLSELRPLDLQGLYSKLLKRDPPLSGGSVLNLHLVLTQALGQAVRWGYLTSNPADGAQPPRPRRKEPVPVDQATVSKVLELIRGHRIEAVVAIAVATGMRRGEILGLRWSDISPDMTTAQVRRSLHSGNGLWFEDPKTRRSRRRVALPDFLRPYLERQREDQANRREFLGDAWQDNDLVIDWGEGSPFNPDTLSSAWRTFCRKNKLPNIRFHDLRHAHATMMLLQGVHPKIVSERLGHASIGITLDTYSHVLPAMQEEAVKAFDALFVPGAGD